MRIEPVARAESRECSAIAVLEELALKIVGPPLPYLAISRGRAGTVSISHIIVFKEGLDYVEDIVVPIACTHF